MKWLIVHSVLLCAIWLPSSADGQNVSNYGAIPEPFLFLLREPAIHDELGLSDLQEKNLRALNEQFDPTLLALRNRPLEAQQPKVEAVLSASREGVSKIFTSEQHARLRQIAYRLRGISFVLDPEASAELRLDRQQLEDIEQITTDRKQKVARLQAQLKDGESSQAEVMRAARRALESEQRRILAELNATQRQQVSALVGRKFDPALLGQVSFRAPELSDSGTWINSEPLDLAQLKGKVVALHFWAFG